MSSRRLVECNPPVRKIIKLNKSILKIRLKIRKRRFAGKGIPTKFQHQTGECGLSLIVTAPRLPPSPRPLVPNSCKLVLRLSSYISIKNIFPLPTHTPRCMKHFGLIGRPKKCLKFRVARDDRSTFSMTLKAVNDGPVDNLSQS